MTDLERELTEAGSRERLAELLALAPLGRQVVRVRVHGRGGKACVRMDLDDGEWIELDPLGSYSSPAKMNFEIAAQVGSRPALKAPDVQEVVALIFWLGEHYETIQTADRAWELGAEYLRDVVLGDVDMSDQASRWQAFEVLDRPDVKARRNAVLHDVKTEKRYVRTQWLVEYLRTRCDPGEAGTMKADLERQGWKKTGSAGRIKATHPTMPRSLTWAFLIVPEGWENQDPEPEAGDGR